MLFFSAQNTFEQIKYMIPPYFSVLIGSSTSHFHGTEKSNFSTLLLFFQAAKAKSNKF